MGVGKYDVEYDWLDKYKEVTTMVTYFYREIGESIGTILDIIFKK